MSQRFRSQIQHLSLLNLMCLSADSDAPTRFIYALTLCEKLQARQHSLITPCDSPYQYVADTCTG